MFQTYETTLEIYIGNQLTNKQKLQAPQQIIIANFMQLAQQIANEDRPMKIKITRPEIIWDKFEEKQKTLTNEVVFLNNKMISFEEESNKENE